MPTLTKIQLTTRIEELSRENHLLTTRVSELEEMVKVGAAASKPAAIPVVSRTERLIANLTKYAPNSKVTCKEHGTVRANRHGTCPVCFCIAAGRRQN